MTVKLALPSIVASLKEDTLSLVNAIIKDTSSPFQMYFHRPSMGSLVGLHCSEGVQLPPIWYTAFADASTTAQCLNPALTELLQSNKQRKSRVKAKPAMQSPKTPPYRDADANGLPESMARAFTVGVCCYRLGTRHSESELVVFLDQGCRLSPESLDLGRNCSRHASQTEWSHIGKIYSATMTEAMRFVRSMMSTLNPHEMARKVAETLTDRFSLSRCELLYSLEESPTEWTSARCGFPNELPKRSHVRGYGLSGKTLTLQNPGDFIASSNILEDFRWSKSLGSEFVRNDQEAGASAIAFLGVPLFHRDEHVQHSPYGAIIAIRPYEERIGWTGPFASHEVALFQLISIAIGHGIDESRWNSRIQSATNWQLSIDMLWGSSKLPDEVFKTILQIFHDSVLSGRYLIAVRDPDKQQIVGRAVYGGFHIALKADTVRRVYFNPPRKPFEEDVLSRVCRLDDGPFFVNTADKDDPWLPHLDNMTRAKHQVDGIVVVIPIPDRTGNVQAVILGELPHDRLELLQSSQANKNQLSKEWASRFKEFARHVSAIIEFMRSDDEVQRRTRIVRSLQSLSSHLFSGRSTLSAIRQMTDSICTEFRFSKCVVYRHDISSARLIGCFGLGVNGGEVRKTSYSVQPFKEPTECRQSLAVHAFQSRREVFVPTMGKLPVDQEDRARVEIPGEYSGYAVPLIHDGRCEGVCVFCWSPDVNPSPPLTKSTQTILSVISSFLALAMVSWRESEHIERLTRQSDSKDLFLSSVVRLGAAIQSTQSHVDSGNMVLSTIAGELATRFSCDSVEIFILEQLLLPSNRNGAPLNAGLNEMRSYRRRASYGTTSAVEVIREIDKCPASTVLRSRQPCIWPNTTTVIVDEHMRTEETFNDPDLKEVLALQGLLASRAERLETLHGALNGKGLTRKNSDDLRKAIESVVPQREPLLDIISNAQGLSDTIHKCFQQERDPLMAFVNAFQEHLPSDHPLKRYEMQGPRQRAWMGVPIVVESEAGNVMYGVMTLGRAVRHEGEGTFSHDEVALARTAASMLAFSFHSQGLIADERASVKNVMSLMRHDDMHSGFSVLGVLADQLSLLGESKKSEMANKREQIVSISQELRRCVDMITLFLEGYDTFGEILAGDLCETEWIMTDSSIGGVINTITEYWTNRLEAANVNIEIELPELVAFDDVVTKRGTLNYIVSALLGNAEKSLMKACRVEPRIQLAIAVHHVTERDGYLRVSVKDNGKGIDSGDPVQVDRCFEKGVSGFSNTDGSQGTGLGLSIVKEMLRSYWKERVNEAISVEGKEGEYACFTVHIPVNFRKK